MEIKESSVRRAIKENRPVAVLHETEEPPTPPAGWKFLVATEQRGSNRVVLALPTRVVNSQFYRDCKRETVAETTGIAFAIPYVAVVSVRKTPYKWYQPVYEAVYDLVNKYSLEELYDITVAAIATTYKLRQGEAKSVVELALLVKDKIIKQRTY